VRPCESFQSGKPNLDTFSGGWIHHSSFEPLVFSAQPFKRHDAGFRTMQELAYPFLNQNDGNPKKKYCPHQGCKYEQHSKKFLDNVETHFEPQLTGLLMTA